MTWPWLFAHCETAKVPPRLPRSLRVPFSQRNGCMVGSPVVEFAFVLRYEPPATKSTRWLLQPPPEKMNESRPPKVPRSRMIPFFQENTCVGELNGPKDAKGSNVVSTVERPTTAPPLSIYPPLLCTPVPSVP